MTVEVSPTRTKHIEPLTAGEDDRWPVSWRDWDFYPVPEAWLTHQRSYDKCEHRGGDRLFAVSAAASGGFIIVRYAHPRVPGVQVKQTNWLDVGDGYAPRAMATGSWPRSIPVDKEQPDGHYGPVESQHLHDVWSQHSERVDSDETLVQAMTDGGLLGGYGDD